MIDLQAGVIAIPQIRYGLRVFGILDGPLWILGEPADERVQIPRKIGQALPRRGLEETRVNQVIALRGDFLRDSGPRPRNRRQTLRQDVVLVRDRVKQPK